MYRIIALLLIVLISASPVRASEAGSTLGAGARFLHGLVMYVPNRVFDALDMVRARVRVGPGAAIDARATQLADVYVGSYTTVYAGLPGPRGRATIPLPAGIETRTGLQASVADVTLEAGMGPGYGFWETGVGIQAGIIGVDVGIDVFEIADFILGIFTIDLANDDL